MEHHEFAPWSFCWPSGLVATAAAARLCRAPLPSQLRLMAQPTVQSNARAMGPLLAEYFDHMFFEGAQPRKGTKTLAAALWKSPALGRVDKRSLPEARRALQGWRRLAPPHARLPMVCGSGRQAGCSFTGVNCSPSRDSNKVNFDCPSQARKEVLFDAADRSYRTVPCMPKPLRGTGCHR